MTHTRYSGYARALDTAARTATPIAQLTLTEPGLDRAGALEIQRLLMEERYMRGERRIGLKLGLTSVAKMRQVGVNEVIWGRLTDAMLFHDAAELAFSAYIHPRAEPEIAFILKRSLPADASLSETALAIEAVLPAIEIIDSRYENFVFSEADVIADNCSAAAVVLGNPVAPRDVGNLGMVMRLDGRVAQLGSSAAILGHPLRALLRAARLAADAGEPLQPGDIVLAGAAMAAEPLRPGAYVSVEVQDLGRVGFTVSGETP
ncbi:fumarylacetoacetate hydrolase family protein [Acetobacter sp. TBRC 12305]|uniref:Fumarylacetoacetate hydrolase family protein n=1 Tax=Acetobacter garciniae TaxID=2817435 RepID=A0A939HMW1_9PROT|nr:fumarylacetoacetate hydrolase family protein [Acetobacter garciniae]MBO1326582.1 fumarylacetoacetate hydrolase family protein [Acetobacter garciniae]MBX0346235.1 fumarylacetoacetate hydrolase family protein [Acetobacter garciniae]